MPDASSTDLLQLEETARMQTKSAGLAAQAPPTESSTSLSENQFEQEREPTRLSENETEPKKAKVETPVVVYVHANLPQYIYIPKTMLAFEGFLLALYSNSPGFQDFPLSERANLKLRLA